MEIGPQGSHHGNEKGAKTLTEVDGSGDKLRWIAGRSADVAERGRLVVDVGEKSVGIFRVEGKLYAYLNVCMHKGGPVCQGKMLPRVVEVVDEEQKSSGQVFDENDPHIICPWHGFEYSIKTGRHAGKDTISLKAVLVEEEGDVLYVTV